jgi:hypothetical protein
MAVLAVPRDREILPTRDLRFRGWRRWKIDRLCHRISHHAGRWSRLNIRAGRRRGTCRYSLGLGMVNAQADRYRKCHGKRNQKAEADA